MCITSLESALDQTWSESAFERRIRIGLQFEKVDVEGQQARLGNLDGRMAFTSNSELADLPGTQQQWRDSHSKGMTGSIDIVG